MVMYDANIFLCIKITTTKGVPVRQVNSLDFE